MIQQAAAARAREPDPALAEKVAAALAHHPDAPLAYRTDEALRIVPISRSVLFELRRQGKIKALKVGRATLWPRAELERFLAELTAEAADQPLGSEAASAQPDVIAMENERIAACRTGTT